MANSIEIKQAINNATVRMKEIVDLCKTEVREMTPDEDKEFNSLREEIDEKKQELKALEDKLANYQRELPNEEKILYEYNSTPNLLNNINLTFNQSIEKKRQLLGLPINVKRNNNLKSKSEITLDKGKHLCPMYWCDEHLGINSNELYEI